MIVAQVSVEELQSHPAFADIAPEQLDVIASAMVRRVYMPGQMIFLEGDTAIGLWFVLRGRVRVIKHSKNGRLQGLCLVHAGKCFGGCPLFDMETYPASAQALDEVTLAVILRASLQQLIQSDIAIAQQLMHIYTSRIALLSRLGEALGTWPVPMRINDCLIACAENCQGALIVRLTHDELASLAGTVREVVTRHLARLEQDNIIKTAPGQIVLLQAEKLSTRCIGHPETR